MQSYRSTEELQDDPSRSISGQTLAKTEDHNVGSTGFGEFNKHFELFYMLQLSVSKRKWYLQQPLCCISPHINGEVTR